jgi:predicted lipoprotein with Yx(FWY)xxD motif
MKQTPLKAVGSKFSPSGRTAITVMLAGVAMLATAVLPMTSGATSSPTTIKVTQNKSWGPTLSLSNGDTLYRLSTDSKNKSVCTGPCAAVWPPVLLAKGQTKAVGVGVSGLGSFARTGGARQVTLDGIPLYTFIGDKKSGQVTGNITDTWGKWYSINPASPRTPPKKKSSGSAPTTTTTGSGVAY